MNELQNLSTEYLFEKLLPSVITKDGEYFHIKISKSNEGTTISYETSEGLQLSGSLKSNKSLRIVIEMIIFWIKTCDMVTYMPYEYRKSYERVFNIHIDNPKVVIW